MKKQEKFLKWTGYLKWLSHLSRNNLIETEISTKKNAKETKKMVKEEADQKSKRILKKPNGFENNRTVFEETQQNPTKPKKPDIRYKINDTDTDIRDMTVEEEKEENSATADDQEKLQICFIECTGALNEHAISECLSYLEDLPREVIEMALQKSADINGGWRYAKSILNRWLKSNINTVEKVRAEELEFRGKQKPKAETEEEAYARKLRVLQEMEVEENDTR